MERSLGEVVRVTGRARDLPMTVWSAMPPCEFSRSRDKLLAVWSGSCGQVRLLASRAVFRPSARESETPSARARGRRHKPSGRAGAGVFPGPKKCTILVDDEKLGAIVMMAW